MFDEQAIFLQALELEPGARSRFLMEACASQEDRERIDKLLSLHNASELEVDHCAADMLATATTSPPEVGGSIGPYTLTERLGEGGMGVVFRARQTEPIQREVALKLIRPGLNSIEPLARFETERQALAAMDHPNIARVLDAGETAGQQPYFVMELVDGAPLIDFCQNAQLDLEQRLSLFVDVCRAVQHAHSKGIIHRDLKPSNVLVSTHDGRPFVKVIDFGIAKAMDDTTIAGVTSTHSGLLLGTPLYMSPEQASAGVIDVDQRSDVYSLGVLLYELVTGLTPFKAAEFRGLNREQLRRKISENNPPPPSHRMRDTVSAGDTVTCVPSDLSPLRRSELDWLVLRAMQKDRDDRYQTVLDLARDVQRYIDHEPVEAGPPSRWYVFRKQIRKHWRAVTISSAVVLILTASTVTCAVFAVRASSAEKRETDARLASETKAEIASAISHFLRRDILERASPYSSPDRDLTLREVLDRAGDRIGERFKSQPLVEAEIRETLGVTYLQLYEMPSADPHLSRCREIRAAELGENHPDTLRASYYCCALLAQKGPGHDDQRRNRLSIIPELGRILERQISVGAPTQDILQTAGQLGYCHAAVGHAKECDNVFAAAKQQLDELEPTAVTALRFHFDHGRALLAGERLPEAKQVLQRLHQSCLQNLSEEHGLTQSVAVHLADALTETREVDDAIDLLKSVVDLRSKTLSPDHYQTSNARWALAQCLINAERFDDAAVTIESMYQIQAASRGSDHAYTIRLAEWLASVCMQRHDLDGAARWYSTAVDSRLRTRLPILPVTIGSLDMIARMYSSTGRMSDAADLHGFVAETHERIGGPDHALSLRALRYQCAALAAAGDLNGAGNIVREIIQRTSVDHKEAVLANRAVLSGLARFVIGSRPRPTHGG